MSTAAPVTVADTSKPVASASAVTPLAPNELALFVPGVGNVVGYVQAIENGVYTIPQTVEIVSESATTAPGR